MLGDNRRGDEAQNLNFEPRVELRVSLVLPIAGWGATHAKLSCARNPPEYNEG